MVVRGRKAADPPPPLNGMPGLGAPDQKAMEGYREGMRVEKPKGTSVKRLCKGEATEAVPVFLRDTRVGASAHEGRPRRRSVMGEGTMERRAGRARPKTYFLQVLSFVLGRLSCTVTPLKRRNHKRSLDKATPSDG